MEMDMAKKSDSTAAAKPKPVQILLDEAEPDTLRPIGGSKSDRFNSALIDSMAKTGWFFPNQSAEDRNRQLFVAVTGLRAFAVADEIEAMLAAQAMAAHHAAMECGRRAMVPDQPFEAAQGFRKAAANASRTFVELLSALDRKRGIGGQQKVTVEHVHIHPGGQAVVGNIATGGGGGAHKIPEEPRGTPARLAHDAAIGAVSPALRSADASQDALPVTSDEERPMPPARRAQHRPTHTGGPGADPGRPDNARDVFSLAAALAMPSRCRSSIRSRSNVAMAPSMVSMSFLVGLRNTRPQRAQAERLPTCGIDYLPFAQPVTPRNPIRKTGLKSRLRCHGFLRLSTSHLIHTETNCITYGLAV
jgi:hypothetical protein